jgi:hypothetical protein
MEPLMAMAMETVMDTRVSEICVVHVLHLLGVTADASHGNVPT